MEYPWEYRRNLKRRLTVMMSHMRALGGCRRRWWYMGELTGWAAGRYLFFPKPKGGGSAFLLALFLLAGQRLLRVPQREP